jgi:hypothetical protein
MNKKGASFMLKSKENKMPNLRSDIAGWTKRTVKIATDIVAEIFNEINNWK